MKKDEVTIMDVAEAAGVSVSTVSRILNGKPDVSERTRAQVRQVIASLGYEPHAQARRLAAGRSRSVALLYPVEHHQEQPIDQLHLDFMIGAAAAAGETNYFFNVITTPITKDKLLSLYRSVQVDGVILMEIYQDDWRVELLRENGFPFAMIGRCRETDGLNFVELDIHAAARSLVEHLVELGHSRIGYIGFPEHMREKEYGPAIRAWEGYHTAIESHNLTPYSREPSYRSEDIGAAADSLLAESPAPTAIVALTDAAAAGALSAVRARDLRVPGDVSVVGLGVDRFAEVLTPRLTTVRFPSYEMGRHAAAMLIAMLEDSSRPAEQRLLAPEVIIRESSGPPGNRS